MLLCKIVVNCTAGREYLLLLVVPKRLFKSQRESPVLLRTVGVYSSNRFSTSTVFGGRGLPSCLPSILLCCTCCCCPAASPDGLAQQLHVACPSRSDQWCCSAVKPAKLRPQLKSGAAAVELIADPLLCNVPCAWKHQAGSAPHATHNQLGNWPPAQTTQELGSLWQFMLLLSVAVDLRCQGFRELPSRVRCTSWRDLGNILVDE